jgi:hypothetical protein
LARLLRALLFAPAFVFLALSTLHVFALAVRVAWLCAPFAFALLIRLLWVVRHKDTSGVVRPCKLNPLGVRLFPGKALCVSNLPHDGGWRSALRQGSPAPARQRRGEQRADTPKRLAVRTFRPLAAAQ